MTDAHALLERVLDEAPWLRRPGLGVCAVGSTALAEACRQVGADGPRVGDLDLAWALDVDAAEAELRDHGVLVETTTHNRARGTLAMKAAGARIEITSYRNQAAVPADAPVDQRLVADLAARDMTVGALAWRVADDRVVDPFHGLQHWLDGRVEPVGDPIDRIREHPIRWLRYHRRAFEWGFTLARSIRKAAGALADEAAALMQQLPAEALAGELRAILLRCASPGRCLLELYEAGLLQHAFPELAPQFDGRPAGPQRHHPEVGQALHMVLVLEWAAARRSDLDDDAALTFLLAALCHDLGKGSTPPEEWPSHRGHEADGIPPIRTLAARLPGLADATTWRLVEAVCRHHQTARELATLRPGTLAELYDRNLRQQGFRIDLFARAIGADTGGRLGCEAEGEAVATRVQAQLEHLVDVCSSIDAGAIATEHAGDPQAIQRALHEARSRAIKASPLPV